MEGVKYLRRRRILLIFEGKKNSQLTTHEASAYVQKKAFVSDREHLGCLTSIEHFKSSLGKVRSIKANAQMASKSFTIRAIYTC